MKTNELREAFLSLAKLNRWSIDRAQRRPAQMALIRQIIADGFGLEVELLNSKCRKEPILWARYLAIYYCRYLAGATLHEIGRVFARDHASIMNALRRVEDDCQNYLSVAEQVNGVTWARVVEALKKANLYEEVT